MPQVPYNPVADVSPSGQGTPYFSDRGATPEAFGAGVGASVERFGAELGRTASTIESNVLATQQLKNEAEVNSATTADLLTSGKLTNDFRQLPGAQAQDALNDHVKSLQTEREKLRDSLSNPEAKRMFDQQTMHRFALDVVNSSNYAATQMKQFTKQTYDDNNYATGQDIARRLRDGSATDTTIEEGKKKIIANTIAAGKINGDSPDATNKNIQQNLTKLISDITSPTSVTQPEKAQKIFDQAKKAGIIDETKVESIQNTLDQHAVQYHATTDSAAIISNRVQSDPQGFANDPKAKVNDMMNDAAAKADELYPVDGRPENVLRHDQYLKQTQANIQATANRMEKAYKDETDTLKKDVLGLTNQTLPSGNTPVSRAELTQLNPKAQAMIDEATRRDPNFQTELNTKLAGNNKVDNNVRPEALHAQEMQWAGKTQAQKMATSITEIENMFDKGLINNKLRDKMYADQAKIKTEAVNTFNADSILSRHSSVLKDAGIINSTTDAAALERYQWIRGSLMTDLQRIQGKTGVPVKGPQEDQVINDLIREISTGKKGFFGGDITKPRYEVMSADAPDWIKNSEYRDARKNTTTGQYQVWRDGKLYDVKAPEEK